MHMGNFPPGMTEAIQRARPVRYLRRPMLAGLGAETAGSGAIKGASAGATVGSAVPVIGTAIGAVVGAVVGALAAILNKPDRDKLAWGTYMQGAGKAPGRAYQELPFELAWQGMQEKYNPWKTWSLRDPKESSAYEFGIIDAIVQGVRDGALTTLSTVEDVLNYVIQVFERKAPGFRSFLMQNPAVMQIHRDFIDRAVAGMEVGGTYKNKRQAHTTLTSALSSAGAMVRDPSAVSPSNPPPTVMAPVPPPTVAPISSGGMTILPVPVSPSQAAGAATSTSAPAQVIVNPSMQVQGSLPAGVSIAGWSGYAPNGQSVYAGNNGKMYLAANGQFFDYAGPVLPTPPSSAANPAAPPSVPPMNAPALSTVTPGAATQATQSTIDQITPLIQQVLSQGASNQQAYQVALDRLTSQGVQLTPQVQQAVAGTVQNAGSADKPWYQNPLTIGALAAAALFAAGVF